MLKKCPIADYTCPYYEEGEKCILETADEDCEDYMASEEN